MQQRTARTVVALVAVLALLALGTAVAVDRLGDDDGPPAAATPTLKPADATTTPQRTPTTATAPTTGRGNAPTTTTTVGSSTPGATTGTGTGTGTEGAADVGDPYFPGLGNGGYDVDDYHLALAYDPGTDRLEGTATITARATQALDRFHLDLAGLTVASVTVDGRSADHERDGDELIVDAPRRLAAGARFTTVVTYAGVPEPEAVTVLGEEGGWITTDEGAFTIDEPDGAHSWFPGNDHPIDRATFTVAVTVPDPLVAVASGRLTGRRSEGGRTTWTWTAAEPMAPYLLQVAVGDFAIDERTGPDGLPMRSATSERYADDGAQAAAASVDMIAFLQTVFGPYPFETYGLLIPAGASPAVAFESQTLSLIPPALAGRDSVLVHELAHQWVGDSVTLARWSDIWLNEGFATYAEWLWSERHGVALAESVAGAYHQVQALGTSAPLTGDPGPEQLFHPVVYQRGALTLQALRQEVGDDAFFRILGEWTRRHAGDSVTTADFVALAEEISGRPLDDLFTSWLQREALPPMPR